MIISDYCLSLNVLTFRPEINIKPWGSLLKDLEKGNTKTSWVDREPYAYWKGNPVVAKSRMDLLRCNVTDKQDWNARVYSLVRISCLQNIVIVVSRK